MNSKFRTLSRKVFAVALLAVATGCSTPKDITYFQDVTEAVIPVQSEQGQIKIEPHDKLSIVVKSRNPEFSDMFNLTVNTNRLGGGQYATSIDGMSNYTVDQQGDIDFPLLGKLHVAGMTRGELAGYIKGLLSNDMVKDAVVTVEFINTGFSVMGEVNRAGRYDFNRDKLNLLQALSIAGDLTIQAKRDNVLLMREVDGEMRSYRVDLTNMQETMKSPAFYLKQGDIIYVEPNDVKKRQATVNGNNLLSWGFWVSVASLAASVAVLIVK